MTLREYGSDTTIGGVHLKHEGQARVWVPQDGCCGEAFLELGECASGCSSGGAVNYPLGVMSLD